MNAFAVSKEVTAPTFTEMLLAIPQDDREFERLDVTPRDFGL